MFVIIVGGGKVGSHLAVLLMEQGYQVKVIEHRPAVLEKLRDELPPKVIVEGDGSDPRMLEEAGIREAEVVAAVTGEDEANLVITSLARFEFGVPRVIGRVNNPKNDWAFTEAMGVDVKLNQADIFSKLIAEQMSLGDMMILLKLRKGEYSIVEEKVESTSLAAGKAIKDLSLPPDSTMVAIFRAGDLIVPHGNTILQPLDEVLAVVHRSQMAQLEELLSRRD